MIGTYPGGGVHESTGSVFYDSVLGTYLHDGQILNQYDAQMGYGFYIIGDSISAAPGNGLSGAWNYDTDGAGTVINPTITNASSGYKRPFFYAHYSDPFLNEVLFFVDVHAVTGALTSVTVWAQSGPFQASVVNRLVTLHTTTTECWPHVLGNRGVNANGVVEAYPGRTLTGSKYMAPPSTEYLHHAIIALGTNDAWSIDIGGGVTWWNVAPTITEATFKAALTARITDFQADGYTVICLLTPHHKFGLGPAGIDINVAIDKIRDWYVDVAPGLGAEVWDIPHTNQADSLHMSQVGAELFANEIYVRMVAAIGGDFRKAVEKLTFAPTGAAVEPLTMYQGDFLGDWFFANPEQNDQSYSFYTNLGKLVNLTQGGVAASDYVQAPELIVVQEHVSGTNDLNIQQTYLFGSDWAIFNVGATAQGYTFNTGASAFVNIYGGQVAASAAAPTDPAHLTRKDYVDGLVGSGNVTLTGAQTITGAKTFTGGIVANSDITGSGTVNVGGSCGGATIRATNLAGASAADDYLMETSWLFGVAVKSNTKTSDIVKLAGTQTITGLKTFDQAVATNNANIVAGGTGYLLSGQLTTSGRILEVGALGAVVQGSFATSNIMQLTGAQTVAGIKTFSSELRCNANIIAYYSDERLKDISGTLTDCLSDVNSWRPVRYTAKEWTPFDSSVVDIGLLAQDVLATTPEAVKPAPFDPNYMTLQYERLVPVLVGAIQEMTKQMEAMAARIAALEAR